jgi:hypothetical protein
MIYSVLPDAKYTEVPFNSERPIITYQNRFTANMPQIVFYNESIQGFDTQYPLPNGTQICYVNNEHQDGALTTITVTGNGDGTYSCLYDTLLKSIPIELYHAPRKEEYSQLPFIETVTGKEDRRLFLDAFSGVSVDDYDGDYPYIYVTLNEDILLSDGDAITVFSTETPSEGDPIEHTYDVTCYQDSTSVDNGDGTFTITIYADSWSYVPHTVDIHGRAYKNVNQAVEYNLPLKQVTVITERVANSSNEDWNSIKRRINSPKTDWGIVEPFSLIYTTTI